jgi:Na+/proline symporter
LSDISLEFGWDAILLFALMIGWPGLLLGGIIGGLAWRRRRWAGAILGALSGLLAWAGAWVAWR